MKHWTPLLNQEKLQVPNLQGQCRTRAHSKSLCQCLLGGGRRKTISVSSLEDVKSTASHRGELTGSQSPRRITRSVSCPDGIIQIYKSKESLKTVKENINDSNSIVEKTTPTRSKPTVNENVWDKETGHSPRVLRSNRLKQPRPKGEK